MSTCLRNVYWEDCLSSVELRLPLCPQRENRHCRIVFMGSLLWPIVPFNINPIIILSLQKHAEILIKVALYLPISLGRVTYLLWWFFWSVNTKCSLLVWATWISVVSIFAVFFSEYKFCISSLVFIFSDFKLNCILIIIFRCLQLVIQTCT